MRLPYPWLVAFVGGLVAVLAMLFVFLIVRRLVVSALVVRRTRRERALAALVHAALEDSGGRDALRRVMRPADARVVGRLLLRLAVDLRGEEAAAIAGLARDLGFLGEEIRALQRGRARRRAVAATSLGILRAPESLEPLVAALRDPDVVVRLAAARAVARVGRRSTVTALVWMLGDRRRIVVRCAQDVLLELGHEVEGSEIVRFVRTTRSAAGRCAGLELIGRLRLPEVMLVVERLGATDRATRLAAARAGALLGDRRLLPPFLALLGDPDDDLRAAAAQGLGLVGDPAAAAPLRSRLGDPSLAVRFHAARALLELGAPGRAALEDTARDGSEAGAVARYALEGGHALAALP